MGLLSLNRKLMWWGKACKILILSENRATRREIGCLIFIYSCEHNDNGNLADCWENACSILISVHMDGETDTDQKVEQLT